MNAAWHPQQLAEWAVYRYGAVQKVPELTEFAEFLLAEPRPRWILEIGSFNGGMLWFFSQFATNGVASIDIDIEQGPELDELPVSVYRVEGDSRLYTTRAKLPTKTYDWLFIDGDHTYNGVKSDVLMYGSLVRPGGLVCMHDIAPHDHYPGQDGAHLVWNEMTGDKREILWLNAHPMKDGVILPGSSCGIGVLRVP